MNLLFIVGALVLLIILTVVGLMSRYRRCASDEILVVFGKAGKKTITNTEGKKEEVTLPSKIIHGGGTFVFPVIQDWRKMSLKPIQIQSTVSGLSDQNIKVTIPVTLTTGIGTSNVLMQNAASRFLTASVNEISKQIEDILIGEVRSLMATMSIEEINADRIKFLGKAKENIETELNKVGFTIININTADISDNARYIENLGKKAATKAQAQAEADIAEERKKSDIQIATTEKERQIAVTTAERDMETAVAQANQEKEVNVAEIEQAKQIKLAEAEKKAGIAEQMTTIEVSQARGKAEQAKAEADKLAGISQVEAEMAVAKLKQDKQVEVNSAQALAEEARLIAEVIVPANKAKEKAIIEAEAEAAKIIKEAQAQADATRIQLEAEAEGQRKKLLAEAEGKRASLMAEADKVTAIEMAPALALEKMIEAGLTPEMIVQYKTVDQLAGIAEAQSKMFEHIHLGQITVYGNENTAGNFMANMAENLNPAFELLKSIPFKKTIERAEYR